jgi:hypothetical protein
MVVSIMVGQLFTERPKNDSKHRPVITSSPAEACEADSKWKVAGFVTRMRARRLIITVAITAATLKDRVVVWKNHPLSYGVTIL